MLRSLDLIRQILTNNNSNKVYDNIDIIITIILLFSLQSNVYITYN